MLPLSNALLSSFLLSLSLALSSTYSPRPRTTVVLFKVTLLVSSPVERERLQYSILVEEARRTLCNARDSFGL